MIRTLVENPIANSISVPFQINTNFGVGQFDRTGNICYLRDLICYLGDLYQNNFSWRKP